MVNPDTCLEETQRWVSFCMQKWRELWEEEVDLQKVEAQDQGGAKWSGVSITREGKTTDYYFTKKRNQNYYRRGVGGMPEPTPLNMSKTEFVKRSKASGSTVKAITKSEQTKKEAAYKEDRRETNDFLNKAWYHAGPRPRKGWKGH